MLNWFRSRATGVAATLLLSLTALGASAASPHEDDCHDAGCGALFVAHDADAHRFVATPAGPDAPHLHCLVCHWARSFRPTVTTKFVGVPGVLARSYAHFDLITAARNTQVAQPPLRSPPAAPVES